MDCRGYLESEVGSFSVGSCSQTAKKGQKEHNCESILHQKKTMQCFGVFFSYVLSVMTLIYVLYTIEMQTFCHTHVYIYIVESAYISAKKGKPKLL